MALFGNDLIALIYLAIAVAGLYLIGKIISFIFKRTEKVSMSTKIKVLFGFRMISFILIIYIILEGFPILEQVDPEYRAILTGAISTAVAFASSGVFTNLVSGIALLLMRPFEVGDLVEVNNQTGVVRTIKLTKIVIKTFDNLKIVMANSDIVSNNITNYTLDLNRLKQFVNLKDKVHYAEELFPSMIKEDAIEMEEGVLKEALHTIFTRRHRTKVHNYIFTMEIEYEGLLRKLDRIETTCKEYKEIFKFRPRYHVANVGRALTLRFRIMTADTDLLFDHQPEFANDLYKIIRKV